MIQRDFFLLIAAIYVAPHMNSLVAIALSSIAASIWVYAFFRGEK